MWRCRPRTARGGPAEWFVDPLIALFARRYHVGLPTAAAVHGVAPQAFQAMVARLIEPEVVPHQVIAAFHHHLELTGTEISRADSERDVVDKPNRRGFRAVLDQLPAEPTAVAEALP